MVNRSSFNLYNKKLSRYCHGRLRSGESPFQTSLGEKERKKVSKTPSQWKKSGCSGTPVISTMVGSMK
jgi:hypothetical protein